jgi:cyclopropane fatty-acyl-phospholipid synthase-like methyltransferase
MGFFTLDIARLVGSRGRVVVVDIQPKMLASLKRRANRAGVAGSIDARVVAPETMALDDLAGAVDFVVAIAMVHELPNGAHFFEECAASLKPGGGMLLVEPAGHVKPDAFGQELEDAARFGLAVEGRPQVWRSHAAVLRK